MYCFNLFMQSVYFEIVNHDMKVQHSHLYSDELTIQSCKARVHILGQKIDFIVHPLEFTVHPLKSTIHLCKVRINFIMHSFELILNRLEVPVTVILKFRLRKANSIILMNRLLWSYNQCYDLLWFLMNVCAINESEDKLNTVVTWTGVMRWKRTQWQEKDSFMINLIFLMFTS